eukprot:scaffold28558_cov101-Isochrysis_galbana.AAC.5
MTGRGDLRVDLVKQASARPHGRRPLLARPDLIAHLLERAGARVLGLLWRCCAWCRRWQCNTGREWPGGRSGGCRGCPLPCWSPSTCAARTTACGTRCIRTCRDRPPKLRGRLAAPLRLACPRSSTRTRSYLPGMGRPPRQAGATSSRTSAPHRPAASPAGHSLAIPRASRAPCGGARRQPECPRQGLGRTKGHRAERTAGSRPPPSQRPRTWSRESRAPPAASRVERTGCAGRDGRPLAQLPRPTPLGTR